jgi:hypothetical protein
MENTFVVNDEPMTIRITIEIIPPKNKEVSKHVILAPSYGLPKDTVVASPVVKDEKVIPLEPLVEPIAPPKKERKPRAPKVKPVEEKVVETVVDNKPTPTDNKVIARAAQMIRFFCKASGISASDITVALLKEKGAFDIIENLSETDAEIAIKEAAK